MYQIEDLKYLNGTRLLLIIATNYLFVFFQTVVGSYAFGHYLMYGLGAGPVVVVLSCMAVVPAVARLINRRRMDLVEHAGTEFYMRYM
jgi:hypothetical protein